jgi:hypothetical protein
MDIKRFHPNSLMCPFARRQSTTVSFDSPVERGGILAGRPDTSKMARPPINRQPRLSAFQFRRIRPLFIFFELVGNRPWRKQTRLDVRF